MDLKSLDELGKLDRKRAFKEPAWQGRSGQDTEGKTAEAKQDIWWQIDFDQITILPQKKGGTPMSRGNNSNSPSVMISVDLSSFVKSQQGEELFCAPVGLYQDVLRNSDYEMDWIFKLSFAYDIFNGAESHSSSFAMGLGIGPSSLGTIVLFKQVSRCLVDQHLLCVRSSAGIRENSGLDIPLARFRAWTLACWSLPGEVSEAAPARPLQGMLFLHRSPLGSHGNLKPSNCLGDGRLQVKLSGFGLWELKYCRTHRTYDETMTDRSELYWMASELLRLPEVPWVGTPQGDLYSFAILMRELIHPWDHRPFDDL
ncbi:hypothetical protein P7K49_024454 [Saguinus oedipus]|uniref:guanylate cyclase n=1 Tax=Saguinus oedipus TaxID=9490 RepID=A0ABQ9UPK6_SAGOE|nr:hypothetical protein P7K49_024454 [Saguinus oedipus]